VSPHPVVLVLVAVLAGIVIGRRTRKPEVTDWNPALYRHIAIASAAIAFLLLAANTVVTTWDLRSDKDDLQAESDCRADLAAPVNDAIARISAGTGRGLVLSVLNGIEDDDLREQVESQLGPDTDAALAAEARAILQASADLEAANAARTTDPVGACQ
jgi:hypothetical protein